MAMNGEDLKCFSVRVIKQIIIEGEVDSSLLDDSYEEDENNTFEESFAIYYALDKEDACNKARADIKKNENKYKNSYGQEVSWRLIEIVDCYEIIDELKSGVEIYSCLHIVSKNMDASNFIDTFFKES